MQRTLAAYQRFRASMGQEIADRVKLHQAQVARLRSASSTRAGAGRAAPAEPLVMLAHGDSWFDYPLKGNSLTSLPTDVTAQLQSMGAVNPHILNLSHWGNTATSELSRPKQELVITQLRDKANWLDHGKPDAILFSAGGNDVAGDQFCIFLDYAGAGETGLDEGRFAEALGTVEASYRDLFAFRDRYASGVPIFGHCYDFPIPNGKHPCPSVGPWLRPSLMFCGYTSVDRGTGILKKALSDFKALLQKLANEKDTRGMSKNNFILVDTQGTLDPAEDWANELHPYPDGFRKIAEKFLLALRAHFPNRI
jgi:hypothetical protein